MEKWKEIIRQSFSSLDKLADFLELSPAQKEQLLLRPKFPLLVPLRLASKMEKGNLNDPIFKQFVPTLLENKTSDTFKVDPVEDRIFRKAPKLLSKYSGRVLLLPTSACAMHCRYCFRQNFDYSVEKVLDDELKLIESNPTIHEVILSGGDPLSLSDNDLERIMNRLSSVSHLKIIRFHSRFPIGIPERITESFLSILKNSSKQIVFIAHINHEKELDEDVVNALKSIQKIGIPVLCQTVLLSGVNDDFMALHSLCLKLISNGITPYYLHQLDQVQGAMHFEVAIEKGKRLIEMLKAELPGYGVFRYVQEIPNATSKTPLI